MSKLLKSLRIAQISTAFHHFVRPHPYPFWCVLDKSLTQENILSPESLDTEVWAGPLHPHGRACLPAIPAQHWRSRSSRDMTQIPWPSLWPGGPPGGHCEPCGYFLPTRGHGEGHGMQARWRHSRPSHLMVRKVLVLQIFPNGVTTGTCQRGPRPSPAGLAVSPPARLLALGSLPRRSPGWVVAAPRAP